MTICSEHVRHQSRWTFRVISYESKSRINGDDQHDLVLWQKRSGEMVSIVTLIL
jgi:hypothetical protein